MNRITFLCNRIEKALERTGSNNIAFCIRLNKKDEEKLSEFYEITRECFGYIKFKTRRQTNDTCLHNFHMAISNDSCKHLQGQAGKI